MKKELRPHQAEAIEMLRQSLRSGKRRPMLQAPTGFGKTLLASTIVDGAMRKGKRVLFVVPALSLIDQTIDAFADEGLTSVGVIQGNHPQTDPSQPVQVASVQTLSRRGIPAADIVVIDEAHRWFDFYGTWMRQEAWVGVPFVGLSATPWTKGLGKHFDDLLVAATTRDLIEKGYLSQFKVFAAAHPDLSAVRTVAGDYHEGDLSAAMDHPQLNADVVDTWLKVAAGRPTLVFAVNLAHARKLVAEFAARGVATGYVDADTPIGERQAIGEDLRAGRIQAVCNVGTLTTGVDWDVRCIVLARPTKSEMLFCQIIGRGLRLADGKDDCLVLDHSDTTLMLGFPDDIHHENLDDGDPKDRARQQKKRRAPRECPACGFVMRGGEFRCSCGFEDPAIQADVESELVAIARHADRPKPGEKQVFFSSLLGIERDRNYKRGWAKAQYRSRYGDWPRGLYGVATASDPDTLAWVREKQLAWSQERRAVEEGVHA